MSIDRKVLGHGHVRHSSNGASALISVLSVIPTVDFNNSVGLVSVGSQAFLLYLSIMYVLQTESMRDTLLFCKHADSFHNLWIFPTFSSQSCVSPACPVFLVVMNVLASQNS